MAVIDIGSNSGRVVVYEVDRTGVLRVTAGTRAALRLVHDVDEKHRLGEDAMARAFEALADFGAIAGGGDARRVTAVATAAIREADNGKVFVERVRRELGLHIEVLDGAREAYLGCLGALRGLPVQNGLVFDLGGGSMQVTSVRGRRVGKSTSLPIGALRLSETFLHADPPRAGEVRRLRARVKKELARVDLARIGKKDHLVGTGGTLRNLAKIDQRERRYPMSSLHGYVLEADRLSAIVKMLARSTLAERDSVPGLSADRADSIVGGALAVESLLEAVDAGAIVVSGQGVREGMAYELAGGGMPTIEQVKQSSLASLASRFAGWRADVAERRRGVVKSLLGSAELRGDAATAAALELAAHLLDIGRSVDFFNRHEHAADIILATDLDGFSHEEVAAVAAILRSAGDRHASLEDLDPLVTDPVAVRRAALLLALADDIEERCPGSGPIAVSVKVRAKVVVTVKGLAAWRGRTLAPRFQRAFGRPLEVLPGR